MQDYTTRQIMKKIILSVLAIFSALASFSQIEVGLQISPTLSTTRFEAKTDQYEYESFKSGLRFSAGPVVDIFLKNNIALSTGLWYSAKRTGITVTDTTAGSGAPVTYRANNQYVQVPIGFKVFTQEITAGLKLFVNVGATLDVKVGEKVFVDEETIPGNTDRHTSFFDSGLLVGIGAEYKIGDHNKAFAGFTYNRGLINVLSEYNDSINKKNLKINSDLFGLMIGYKF